jgi:hypothetical protein
MSTFAECAECGDSIEEHGVRTWRGDLATFWRHVPDPNTGRSADNDHTAQPIEEDL